MASSSFRDNMNSLGWSRREQPASTSKPSGVYGTLQKLNPFNNEGYVSLPVHENDEGLGAPLPARTRREEEDGRFARKSCSYSSSFQNDCFSNNNVRVIDSVAWDVCALKRRIGAMQVTVPYLRKCGEGCIDREVPAVVCMSTAASLILTVAIVVYRRPRHANACLAVSRWDRLLIFGGLNLAAVALSVVCFTLFPILSLKPTKFAIL